MVFLRLASIFVTMVLLISLEAAAQQPGERNIYCCDDAQGRPVCGDILPSACYGQAYRVISPQGTVRRHVAAPLTPEEIARRDAEEKARKEEEARLLAQRRLDEALLETYKSLEDIDDREERALADVERSVEDIRVREVELIEQRGRYRQEAEFYEGREPPRELTTALRLIETELMAYRSVIDAKELEKSAIRARYAADRRRYAELIASGMTRR
jgi:hypothetical protein